MQVVQPATTQEIAELLRSAQAKGASVAVRGGRTLEQILPAEGAASDLLFDMSRMNRIESIEKGNLLARAEAGTITAAVQAAAEAEGLFYPPDPTSLETSTIGGNIACSATGPRQLKYGGTRDFVLGLEVVLPSGEHIRTGADMQKSVAGYDMTRFLVGSGARFGVVTGAVLRLLPKPQGRRTILCSLPSWTAGAAVALAVLKSGMTPAALELLDLHCLEVDREAWTSLGAPWRGAVGAESVLLIELDGVEASVNRQHAQVERLSADTAGALVLSLTEPDEVSRAWELRRRLLPRLMAGSPTWAMALAAIVPDKLLLPFSSDEPPVSLISNGPTRVACFAHAGTGVLHLFVGIDPAKERDGDEAIALVRRMLQRLRDLGAKLLRTYGPARRLLGEEEAPASALMERLAAAQRSFDPKGVMIP
ncbi:MAG: FAD-binding oxidoreductase [candidate division NC10 bacterium]|nr:FAD-binding oxidoreductase [candidate division NC10 bacterium]